jgi:hypothetical protein
MSVIVVVDCMQDSTSSAIRAIRVRECDVRRECFLPLPSGSKRALTVTVITTRLRRQ